MSGHQKTSYSVALDGVSVEYARVSSALPAFEAGRYAAGCVRDVFLEKIGDTEFHGTELEAIEYAFQNYESHSKKAIAVGTETHDGIEAFFKTGLLPVASCEAVQNCFNAFKKWHGEFFGGLIASEAFLVSHKYCFAGTCDLVFTNKKNQAVIADFKTGKGFYEGYGPQLAAYRMMWNDNGLPVTINHAMSVRLDKVTGEYETKEYNDQAMENYTAWIENSFENYYRLKPRRLKLNPMVLKYWSK